MYLGERGGIRAAEAVLKEAGFTVSQECCSRPSCFDFAARKNHNLVLIRVQSDVGSVSPTDSLELKAISKSISAASLLISDEAREKPLEDDTVYLRHSLFAVTPRTLENIVLHKALPLIQASPGGCYVEIDEEAVKRRRQELGLSTGDMAKMVGISRRTLYGYERGMTRASVTVAYKLIYTLGIPVAKPINIFEKSRNQPKRCFLTKARLAMARNSLLSKILTKLARYPVTTVKKAPFDFVMELPGKKMRIIGGVANDKEQGLDRRVDEILSVSRIVQAHPILVTEGKEPPNKDILCIHSDDVSKIRNLGDLVASFT
jgi:putative transcriptional regulator